ncbi:MAG: hypothetical protein MUC49_17675, partial [Raineya sp.]|nr:hypothetical protein [Raineya sp.]
MADFDYKDYGSNGWGHSQDDYSDKELSKYIGDGSKKKLTKEERKEAKAALKQEKIQKQKERVEKRLAQLLAMEEAEKKNTPQNKTEQETDKKLV